MSLVAVRRPTFRHAFTVVLVILLLMVALLAIAVLSREAEAQESILLTTIDGNQSAYDLGRWTGQEF